MKNNRTPILIFTVVFLMVVVIITMLFRHQISYRLKKYMGIAQYSFYGNKAADCENCDQLFADGVATHEQAYLGEGISSQSTDKGLIQLKQQGVLQSIVSNQSYRVRELNYSQPLLLPKAIDLLNQLSLLYHKKCDSLGLIPVPFEVTSATRSVASVKKLSRNNPNAIENSAHLHGKTFDISYRAFIGNDLQRKLFIEALATLHREKECYVKFERNGCLHITAK